MDLQESELYEYRYRLKEKKSSFRFWIVVLSVLLILLSVRTYFSKTYAFMLVDGSSMNDTLDGGDVLLMRRGAKAERGDVIVVDVSDYGFRSASGEKIDYLIKRLIATEGDSVYCEDGQVYLKKAGESEFSPLDEPYLREGLKYDFAEYAVGDGEIFFLGDNRLSSLDSRYKEGLSHLDGLYEETDVFGVVSERAIKSRKGLTSYYRAVEKLKNWLKRAFA